MSGVATAIGGAALIGGGVSLLASNASSNAAQKQTDAANAANGLQASEFQQQQQNEQPWLTAGANALTQMQDPKFSQTFNPTDMESVDPGYAFRMQQGQQALERSAAARGGLMSGGTMKALTQYGQDYASGEYQNAYNRFTNDQTNQFNRLASVAGAGQIANGQIGAAGTNMANQVGENTMGAANAQGAAGIASANTIGNTMSSIGNNAGNWAMTNQMMNRFAPQQTQTLGSLGTVNPNSWAGSDVAASNFNPVMG